MAKRLLIVALVVAAIVAIAAWPHINDVETGRTPEYPGLRAHDYGAGAESVTKGVRDVLARLPRWTYVGTAHGPEGTTIQAIHATRVFRFKDEVTIRIRRDGGRTKVSVRSRSRVGKWDFGQNARNIEELLYALDREVF